MLEAAIEEAREAVDAAEDRQQLRSLFDNILTTLAQPDSHAETVSGILAAFRDGAPLSELKRAIKQFLNRLEPAEGGSKASGYVRLLLARHVVGKKEEDYDPVPRKKKMAGDFALSKVRNPSEPLRELLKYRTERRKFPFLKEGPAPAAATTYASKFPQYGGRLDDYVADQSLTNYKRVRDILMFKNNRIIQEDRKPLIAAANKVLGEYPPSVAVKKAYAAENRALRKKTAPITPIKVEKDPDTDRFVSLYGKYPDKLEDDLRERGVRDAIDYDRFYKSLSDAARRNYPRKVEAVYPDFWSTYTPAEGGSKRSGYVRLLYARHIDGKTEADYDPEPRKKQMAKSFSLKKVKAPSAPLLEVIEYRKQQKQAAREAPAAAAEAIGPSLVDRLAPTTKPSLVDRLKRRAVKFEAAPAPAPAPAPTTSTRRRFRTGDAGRIYEETPEERMAKREAARAKERKETESLMADYKNLTYAERAGMFRSMEVLGIPIPANMKRAYDNWVAKGRPSGEVYDSRIPAKIMRLYGNRGKGMSGGRYKLRKAPGRPLFWVVGEDGKHHSKDPLPRERAEAQMRALYAAMKDE